MSGKPVDQSSFFEPERYEFRARPSYRFEPDRREFFRLFGIATAGSADPTARPHAWD